jgi:hypothetical protein
MLFTPDGSNVLLSSQDQDVIEVFDAIHYSFLGYYSTVVEPSDTWSKLFAVDSSGRAIVGTTGGLIVAEMSQPIIQQSASVANLTGASCPGMNSRNVPLDDSASVGLFYSPASSIYFGGQPGSVLPNSNEVAIPPSSVSGLVDVECIGTDGNTNLSAFGFSYGVSPLSMSANLLPPTGNPVVYLFGGGFSPKALEVPSVAIGGQPAANVTNLIEFEFNSLQQLAAQIPNGAPGASVDVTVSSSSGTGTLANAATYIPSATILPASGILQLLFDTHRNLLYALKASEVDVLNPSTLTWQSPIALPAYLGTTNYDTMALSPDGTHLVAASAGGYAAILDPASPSSASVVSLTSNPGNQSGNLSITKYNKAILAGSPCLEIDLSTLAVRSLGYLVADLIRASADGSALYGVDLNISSGEVHSLDPITYAQKTQVFGFLFWSDLAVSRDGKQFVGISGGPGIAGDLLGFFDSGLHLLNSNPYPMASPPDDSLVIGSTFSPRGKVVIVALGDSIEFWDAAQGTLRARLMTPEELHTLVYPQNPTASQIAFDSTGQTLFAVSATGLTVMGLPQPVDDMNAASWRFDIPARGDTGGFAARAAAMRNRQNNTAQRIVRH